MKEDKKKERSGTASNSGMLVSLLADLNCHLQGYIKSLKTTGTSSRSD